MLLAHLQCVLRIFTASFLETPGYVSVEVQSVAGTVEAVFLKVVTEIDPGCAFDFLIDVVGHAVVLVYVTRCEEI